MAALGDGPMEGMRQRGQALGEKIGAELVDDLRSGAARDVDGVMAERVGTALNGLTRYGATGAEIVTMVDAAMKRCRAIVAESRGSGGGG